MQTLYMLACRPVRPEDERILRDMLADLHEAFKDTVRSVRGAKLDAAKEDELFSGRVWTGRQAAALGLVDGVATLDGKMRERFGDKVLYMNAV